MASSENRYLVVGLGNPGPKYENTRHNIGFLVIDELAKRCGSPSFQKKFKGLLTEVNYGSQKVIFLKPQTYMNLSGDSVREVASFFKIPIETHLLVISDDLDLPPGSLRIRHTGGTGGHNGLKSITEVFSTEGFPRIRVGIGRSANIPTEDYVLAQIPEREKTIYTEAITITADAVETVIKEGIQKAMNLFNKRKSDES